MNLLKWHIFGSCWFIYKCLFLREEKTCYVVLHDLKCFSQGSFSASEDLFRVASMTIIHFKVSKYFLLPILAIFWGRKKKCLKNLAKSDRT